MEMFTESLIRDWGICAVVACSCCNQSPLSKVIDVELSRKCMGPEDRSYPVRNLPFLVTMHNQPLNQVGVDVYSIERFMHSPIDVGVI